MPPLQLRPAFLTEIFKAAQAAFGQLWTILTHHSNLPFRFKHQSARVDIALIMHTAIDADPRLKNCWEEVAWHEFLARAKTVAILAAAELVGVAVGFIFQEAHLFVADGVDEVIEVLVYES